MFTSFFPNRKLPFSIVNRLWNNQTLMLFTQGRVEPCHTMTEPLSAVSTCFLILPKGEGVVRVEELSKEPRVTPMVPRRTRMVTKPQRKVILMLLKVLWILQLQGSALPRLRVFEVDKPALVLCLQWLSCPIEVEIDRKLSLL